jgi:hypothetical protein
VLLGEVGYVNDLVWSVQGGRHCGIYISQEVGPISLRHVSIAQSCIRPSSGLPRWNGRCMISNCKHCSIRGPCTILLCSFRLTITLEGSATRIAFYLIQGLWGSIAKMPLWGRSPSESIYFSGWLTVFSSSDAQLSQLQRLILSFTFKTCCFYSRWDGKEYPQPSRSFVAQSISCSSRLARHISLTDTRAPDTDDQQEAQT